MGFNLTKLSSFVSESKKLSHEKITLRVTRRGSQKPWTLRTEAFSREGVALLRPGSALPSAAELDLLAANVSGTPSLEAGLALLRVAAVQPLSACLAAWLKVVDTEASGMPSGSDGELMLRVLAQWALMEGLEAQAAILLQSARIPLQHEAAPRFAALQRIGFRLGPAAAALAHWRPEPQSAALFAALQAAEETLDKEGLRTLRWLIAMHGPAQPLFATYRRSASGPRQALALPMAGHNVCAGEALVSALPRFFDPGMVTVTVGRPYAGPEDLYMTFHGRTPVGFSGGAQRLTELTNAALVSAWLSDAARVGEHIRALLSGLGAACADAKTQAAASYLENAQEATCASTPIDAIWAQVDRGEARLTDVMSAHVAAFFDQAWRRYAHEKGTGVSFLTPALAVQLDQDAAWAKAYFNSGLFAQALIGSNARLMRVPADVWAALVAEQVAWGTLEF